jgi:hypothetical protein
MSTAPASPPDPVPRPPAPVAATAPPPGYDLRWWAWHFLLTGLVVVLVWLGALRPLPLEEIIRSSGVPFARYVFLVLAPSAVVIGLIAFLPWIPKLRDPYRRGLDYLIFLHAAFFLWLCWVVYHVKRRQKVYSTAAWVSLLFGAPALVYLGWRGQVWHADRQHQKEALDRAWGTLLELVCDQTITAEMAPRYARFQADIDKLPPRKDERGEIIRQAAKALGGLRPEPKVRFTDLCARAGAGLADDGLDQWSHPEIGRLLKARLFIRASQNGAHLDELRKALPLLRKGFEEAERAGWRAGPRVQVAYHNYLGVVLKLQAQREEFKDGAPPPGRNDLLKEAYGHYRQAHELAEQHGLNDALARARSNVVSYKLMIFALALDPAQLKALKGGPLDYEIRTLVDGLSETNPAHVVECLGAECTQCRLTYAARHSAPTLFTLAQSECLRGLACQRHFERQQAGPLPQRRACAEARRAFERALACLEVALMTFDEIVLLDHPQAYHLGALLEYDQDLELKFQQIRDEARRARR